MKIFSAFVALIPLGTALSPLEPRQEASVQITNVTAVGPGCPPNAFTVTMANDTDAATFGFNAYQTALGAGIDAEEREKHCQLFWNLRFPVGCTAASIKTVYHGSATLGEGTTGVLMPSYNLSPGELIHEEPVPSFFDGEEWLDGDTFERVDEVVAKVQVDDEEQRDVQFVVRSRSFLQTTGEGQEGSVSSDDITVTITGVEAC